MTDEKDYYVLPSPQGTLQLSCEQKERLSRKYGLNSLTLSLAVCPSAEGTLYTRFDLNAAGEEVSRVLLNTEIGPDVSGKVGGNAASLYLMAMMLQACWEGGSSPPPSLKQLVLDSLVQPERSRLLAEARDDDARHLAAIEAVDLFEPDEHLSRPKLTTRLHIDDLKARRWLNEGFAELVEAYRRRLRPADEPAERPRLVIENFFKLPESEILELIDTGVVVMVPAIPEKWVVQLEESRPANEPTEEEPREKPTEES